MVICAGCATAPAPSSTGVVSPLSIAENGGLQSSADCNAPAVEAHVKVSLAGRPFEALPSHDGCWVFVSIQTGRGRGGIAVLRRTSGTLTLARTVMLPGPLPAGIALSHDGGLLIVPDGPFVHFLDTAKLTHGAVPLLGTIDDGAHAGAINAAITHDDQLLFVSDEGLRQVTVIDLAMARRDTFGSRAVIGRIPTGMAPVGLALSAAEDYLFITSEQMPQLRSPPSCRARGGEGGAAVPSGGLEVIALARLQPRPADAIVAMVAAGCSPVRAALSSRDGRLYVTARASDALLVFDSERLVSDPTHALLATLPVGNAPVGLALLDEGRRVVVANSARFGGRGGQMLTVIDASRIDQGNAAPVEATISVGHFPRELRLTDDGKTLFVTDFDSDEVECLSVDRLPVK